MTSVAPLSEKISVQLADAGYLLRPIGVNKNGSIIWPRFLPSPQSHMLIVSSVVNRNLMRSAVKSVLSEATTSIVTIDSLMSPLKARLVLYRTVKRVHGGLINEPTLIVVNGLESMIDGVRRDSTIELVMERMRCLLRDGPEHGVHVLLNQVMNDDGSRMLSRLNVDWDWLATVGRLTPVCSEIALGDGFASSLPEKSKTIVFRSKSNGASQYFTVIIAKH